MLHDGIHVIDLEVQGNPPRGLKTALQAMHKFAHRQCLSKYFWSDKSNSIFESAAEKAAHSLSSNLTWTDRGSMELQKMHTIQEEKNRIDIDLVSGLRPLSRKAKVMPDATELCNHRKAHSSSSNRRNCWITYFFQSFQEQINGMHKLWQSEPGTEFYWISNSIRVFAREWAE